MFVKKTPEQVIANYLGLEDGSFEFSIDKNGTMSVCNTQYGDELGENATLKICIPVSGNINEGTMAARIWQSRAGQKIEEIPLNHLGIDLNKLSIVASALKMAHYNVANVATDIGMSEELYLEAKELSDKIIEADKNTLSVGDFIKLRFLRDGYEKSITGHVVSIKGEEILIETEKGDIYKINNKTEDDIKVSRVINFKDSPITYIYEGLKNFFGSHEKEFNFLTIDEFSKMRMIIPQSYNDDNPPYTIPIKEYYAKDL